MRRQIRSLLLIALLCCGAPAARSTPAAAEAPSAPMRQAPAPLAPASIGEAVTLVSGGVSSFALAADKLFWSLNAYCPPVGPASAAAGPAPQAASDPVRVSRVPARGGDARTIFERNDPRQPGVCNPYTIRSNIVADDSYLYWLEDGGLVRLPVTASPGDAPEVMNAAVAGAGELAIGGGTVYGVSNRELWGIPTAGPWSGFSLLTFATQPTSLSFDGQYLYVIEAGALKRVTLAGDVRQIAGGVSAYAATGLITPVCSPFDIFCGPSDRVFYAQGAVVRYFDNRASTTSDVFLQEPAGTTVAKIIADDRRVYTYESLLAVPCSPQPCFGGTYADTLFRTPILFSAASGYYAGAPEQIYRRTRSYAAVPDSGTPLRGDATFLYWQEDGQQVKRIYRDAASIPVVNLAVVEPQLEITQGVQRTDNTTRLIAGRRTFVRVFARSDGAPVAGVNAALFVSGGVGVQKINPIGLPRTLVPSPDRDNIDQSFLFEIPVELTSQPSLTISAVVNPDFVPAEPTYADNTTRAVTVSFQPSPRLEVYLVKMRYEIGGVWYEPTDAEVQAAADLFRRLYPLASAPGYASSPTPGFRPHVITITDYFLGMYMQFTTSPLCSNLKNVQTGDVPPKTVDLRSSCATIEANAILESHRVFDGLGDGALMYGMISPRGVPAAQYPRGWADRPGIAAGPSDDPLTIAHEVGHMLGQAHPFTGSAYDATNMSCGNSLADGTVDKAFPYPASRIGPADGSVNGFDPGQRRVLRGGITVLSGLAVKPSTTADLMGYCSSATNFWISDFTYNCFYRTMREGAQPKDCIDPYVPPKPSRLRPAPQAGQAVAGDWLVAAGSVRADGGGGSIAALRRVGDAAPTQQPGGAYALQQVGAGGGLLASTPFDATPATGSDALLGFSVAAPFAAGVREVRVVAGGQVLASAPVSASPPAVSGVALVSPPSPIVGALTLGWGASDPDGGQLTFDVLASRDGGATFTPLARGAPGASLTFDAADVGGGSVIFRVVASDGALTAQADSPAYAVEAQPPRPAILSVRDGDRLQWGQPVALSGEAPDPQDGGVADGGLVWSTDRGVLGAGPLLTAQLPAGENRITLTATNSAGVSASATVTVFVGDDVGVPGPTLSAAPGQIAWAVAPGTAAPQTAQLSVDNAGGGSISWQASDDAPWLTLSASAGDGPAAITLTADVAGLPEGTVRTATVTLTRLEGGQVAETIEVPVTLTVGNTEAPPPAGAGGTMVYLPIVVR